MTKRKANHIIPGMNAAASQGKGAGYSKENGDQPLSEMERMHNKKRKKNQ